jgi:hypothetical protein
MTSDDVAKPTPRVVGSTPTGPTTPQVIRRAGRRAGPSDRRCGRGVAEVASRHDRQESGSWAFMTRVLDLEQPLQRRRDRPVDHPPAHVDVLRHRNPRVTQLVGDHPGAETTLVQHRRYRLAVDVGSNRTCRWTSRHPGGPTTRAEAEPSGHECTLSAGCEQRGHDDPAELGRAGADRIRTDYLPDRHLLQYAELVHHLAGNRQDREHLRAEVVPQRHNHGRARSEGDGAERSGLEGHATSSARQPTRHRASSTCGLAPASPTSHWDDRHVQHLTPHPGAAEVLGWMPSVGAWARFDPAAGVRVLPAHLARLALRAPTRALGRHLSARRVHPGNARRSPE